MNIRNDINEHNEIMEKSLIELIGEIQLMIGNACIKQIW